ncbi:hypothetical protein QBC34DRAFT_98933 [Podospora aff. communis PSN243]|uniref:Uncharacterized protein n=1 Tax=Podospora aff. communis PSN243 TaxID=3040156 RepID=A0AAV9GNZ9_9PEZI|nr:hypothetical protein QBC34DRAFT_98933 [Podospora aff. communis PSN243]
MKTVGFVVAGWAVGAASAKITKWGRDSNEREYKPALLNAPAPMTTSPPRYVPRELENRATTDNTCAYVSGSADYPLYCDATAYCASNSINSHVGCCPDSATTSCNVWTACYDSTDQASYTTDNGFTLWCGFASYPHCITHIYRDTSGAATALSGYTLLGCAVAAATDSVYYNPFIFSTSSRPRTTSFPIAPTGTADTSSATTGRTTTTVTHSPTPVPASSAAPVGAIAGGVVGGVAAISLIIFGIWFLIRQNNKAKEDIGASPPAPGPPPPFTGYNNGPVGGTPATQMSQPAGGYFAPAQPEVAAAAAGMGAMGMGMAAGNQRSSVAKPGFEMQTQRYNAPPQQGGLGITSSPPPPVYQGTPSPPLGSAGAEGRYSGYGSGRGQSGAVSPRDNVSGSGMGYAAAAGVGAGVGAYHHRESQSTQGGYQPQDGYAREGGGGYPQQDGGYGRDEYHAAPAPARESYQQQATQPRYQQEGYNQPPTRESHQQGYQYQQQQQQETYNQPPTRESYNQQPPSPPQRRPEPTYQAYQPPPPQESRGGGGGGYEHEPPSPEGLGPGGGGYQAQNPQPPTNYHPPQPVYQPYPTGGYRNEFASELPTQRGDGEVRELP